MVTGGSKEWRWWILRGDAGGGDSSDDGDNGGGAGQGVGPPVGVQERPNIVKSGFWGDTGVVDRDCG